MKGKLFKKETQNLLAIDRVSKLKKQRLSHQHQKSFKETNTMLLAALIYGSGWKRRSGYR